MGKKMEVFHYRVGSSYQLAEFHRKKVMGLYFGRMEPASLRPMEEAGWPDLFIPTDAHRSQRRQARDFTPREWEFIESFFYEHDYAGILLYCDVLPAATVAGFHTRFGEPAAEMRMNPGLGWMQFIPKRAAARLGQAAVQPSVRGH